MGSNTRPGAREPPTLQSTSGGATVSFRLPNCEASRQIVWAGWPGLVSSDAMAGAAYVDKLRQAARPLAQRHSGLGRRRRAGMPSTQQARQHDEALPSHHRPARPLCYLLVRCCISCVVGAEAASMAALTSSVLAPAVFGSKTAMRGAAITCNTAKAVAPAARSSLVVEGEEHVAGLGRALLPGGCLWAARRLEGCRAAAAVAGRGPGAARPPCRRACAAAPACTLCPLPCQLAWLRKPKPASRLAVPAIPAA